MEQAYSFPEGLDTLPEYSWYRPDLERSVMERYNALSDEERERFDLQKELDKTKNPPKAYVGMDEDTLLRTLVAQGMKQHGYAGKPEYEERVAFELDVIINKGFSRYFLMIWDILWFCRRNGIVYGKARGSGASSLAGHCLKITNIDPIRYKLLFERFLDYERDDYPDYDLDIQDDRRHEIREYLSDKYGTDHVAGISTFTYFSPKSAFLTAGSVLKVPYAQMNELSSLVETKEDIRKATARIEQPGVAQLAEALVGRLSSVGRHAAGVVVADKPITEYAALESRSDPDKKGERIPVLDVDKRIAEEIGLIKIDLLGLVNLSIIDTAVKMIAQTTGKKIDWKALEPNDPKVFNSISEGHTAAIFQAEQSASTNLIMNMGGVHNFEELVTSNALVRSGAYNAFGPDYIATKKGHKKPKYPTEKSKEFLEDSLGFCVPGYQKIPTPDGPVRMSDLKVGDTVYGEKYDNVVLFKVNTGMKSCVRLTTKAGRSIDVSEDHPIKTLNGWKPAGELKKQDSVLTHEGTDTIVSNDLILDAECYDIQVSGDNTFLIDDIVTHNCVMQEQSMLLMQHVAGMSVAESNQIRRLTSKKAPKEKLAPFREKFINGCIANGVSTKDSERLWTDLETTSEYQFNRCLSHDTVVEIKDHGEMTMQQVYDAVQAGEELYVLGPETIKGPVVKGHKYHKIVDVHNNGTQPTMRTMVSSTEYIDATLMHKHRISKRWKEAYRIHHNDPIWMKDGKRKVTMRRYAGIQQTYDLELADEPHAFYANGFVTHNSHAVAYSMLSYACSHLKYYFPGQYMTAVLEHTKKPAEISTYLAECKRLGITVNPPDINKSEANYTYKDGQIYMGLSSIKYISDVSAQKIIKYRPYKTYEEFEARVYEKGTGLNTRMLSALKAVGAIRLPGIEVNEDEVKSNFYEYLGIPSFDDVMLTSKMRSRITPLSEYKENGVQIIAAITQNIVSKNGWSRAEVIDEYSSASFFMDSPDAMFKGRRYLALVANNSLIDKLDLSDYNDRRPLVRWLNGEMDEGTWIVWAKSSVTKNKKTIGTIVYSHNGELRRCMVFGSKLEEARAVCKPGKKVRLAIGEWKGTPTFEYAKPAD